MSSMPRVEHGCVVGGIDTHKQTHTAAVLASDGRVLGTATFPATADGYAAVLGWLQQHGSVARVGVEQTGSYGAGVGRWLVRHRITVVEVTGPDRRTRRSDGKDDTLDAIAAAEAARIGQRVQPAKDRDGAVEALRSLRVARSSAVRMRRQAQQQLQMLLVSAPDSVREPLRGYRRMTLVRRCTELTPDASNAADPATAVELALRSLATRVVYLTGEIATLDTLIKPLVTSLAGPLLELPGVGIETAAQLLITAGENPARLRSEASFAKLCGAAPLPASSGQTRRHRLNRGGDRQANSALHIIAVTRLRSCPESRAYAARRRTEGLSTREILRCQKRYIAREIYYHLIA